MAYTEAELLAESVECDLKKMTLLSQRRSLVTFDDRYDHILKQDLVDLSTQIRQKLNIAERSIVKKGPFESLYGDSQTEAMTKDNARQRLAHRLSELVCRFRELSQAGVSSRVDASARSGVLQMLECTPHSAVVDGCAFGKDVQNDVIGASTVKSFDFPRVIEQRVDSQGCDLQVVANSVNQLASILKELAILVIDQGSLLDRIDYNMETATQRTKRATTRLAHTDKQQDQAHPAKCLVLLISVIILLTAALVYRWSTRKM